MQHGCEYSVANCLNSWVYSVKLLRNMIFNPMDVRSTRGITTKVSCACYGSDFHYTFFHYTVYVLIHVNIHTRLKSLLETTRDFTSIWDVNNTSYLKVVVWASTFELVRARHGMLNFAGSTPSRESYHDWRPILNWKSHRHNRKWWSSITNNFTTKNSNNL